MAIMRPFRANRPAKKYQSLIPALPYDVMSSDEAREMVKGNEYSFLHVDKAEIDLDKSIDVYSDAVYNKAKENLDKLKSTGALIQDKTPCLYIYKQIMNARAQVGIVGCTSIDDYINGVIKKHEHTLAKKEADRIKHVDTTNANTGPIFLTYRKDKKISAIVDSYMDKNQPIYDFFSDRAHQIVWRIDSEKICAKISALFDEIPSLYIADGHHRCASAVNVGLKRRGEHPQYTGEEEFNFFLSVAFPDEDLEIMDYNRVVKDLNSNSKEEFLKKVSRDFIINEKGKKQRPVLRHTFGMYLDSRWYLLTAKPSVIDESDPVGRLDVSILQNRLLSPILGIKDPKNDERIDFIGGIRGLDELERRANSDMRLAFAMYPTTVSDLMAIADAGLIMPPKSTWFEPKLLSGIFIHDLS